jgi:hypothetical protein
LAEKIAVVIRSENVGIERVREPSALRFFLWLSPKMNERACRVCSCGSQFLEGVEINLASKRVGLKFLYEVRFLYLTYEHSG